MLSWQRQGNQPDAYWADRPGDHIQYRADRGRAATNIVTDEVTFTAEIRSHSMDKLRNEAAHMEECLKAACLEMGGRL